MRSAIENYWAVTRPIPAGILNLTLEAIFPEVICHPQICAVPTAISPMTATPDSKNSTTDIQQHISAWRTAKLRIFLRHKLQSLSQT